MWVNPGHLNVHSMSNCCVVKCVTSCYCLLRYICLADFFAGGTVAAQDVFWWKQPKTDKCFMSGS